jgi:methionine biosynthesis protein MetW
VPCGGRTFLTPVKPRRNHPANLDTIHYKKCFSEIAGYNGQRTLKNNAMTITPKYHIEEIFNPQKTHPDDAHNILMRLVPSASKVLELGCASGYLSGYMEQMLGCRVTGLEFDPVATAIAQTRSTEVHTVDLDAPDILRVAEASAPYDVLLAAAILEHLRFPERLLKDACNLLKPGARVIVSLPNIAHWSIRLKLLRGQFDYQDYGVMDRTHVRLYTLKTGRELIESEGYKVDQVFIAGSGLQNLLNAFARRSNRPPLKPLLPNLLGYELIYLAYKSA